MKQKPFKFRRLLINFSILLLVSVILKIISGDSYFIERYYSASAYVKLSSFLRMLIGSVPFSVGDVLITGCLFYGLFIISKWLYAAFQKRVTRRSVVFHLLKIIRAGLAFYIAFTFLWGLNYKREGIASQLHFRKETYTTEELKNLSSDLAKQTNAAYSAISLPSFQYESSKTIFNDAAKSYTNAAFRYPFLQYTHPSIKNTLSNQLNNYFGIAGYYNPFTGEAQVNTSVPHFLLPFLTCHEVAHQVGYANEEEASFAAYLVSKESSENAFRYSMYFTLFNYANRLLFLKDSLSANTNLNALDSMVKIDESSYQIFLGNKSGTGAHYSSLLYNYYLEVNSHEEKNNYDEVVVLLIAYRKLYGTL